MIDFYTWGTPNGHKVAIFLEESGLDYRVCPVDITSGGQFSPEFLAISPNNKIPAIVDQATGISLFESGAILLYLAEKTGRFLPSSGAARYKVLQWLMFQMGGFGPMLGQAHHFLRFAPETIPYACERYQNEALRLYSVLDQSLQNQDFIAGEYSIADMALLPWARYAEWQNVVLDDFAAVRAWHDRLMARPAVLRALTLSMSEA